MIKKRVFGVRMAAVLFAFSVAGCSGGGGTSPLVGTWFLEEDDTEEILFELSEDGIGNLAGESFAWTAKNGRLSLNADGEYLEFDYHISGSVLTLTRDGESLRFRKMASSGGRGSGSAAQAASGGEYYATSNLRVRSEPDVSQDNQIGLVSAGETVTLLETGAMQSVDGINAPWFKIRQADGTIGWVFSGFLAKAPNTATGGSTPAADKNNGPPPMVEEPKPSEPAPNEADFEVKQLQDNTLEITDYTGNDADLVIPAWLYGLKVTKLGHGAFYMNRRITSVVVPNTVKEIGESCFRDCGNLTSVVLGDGVEVIPEEAFKSCSNLSRVTFGSRVKEIGNQAFYSCKFTFMPLPASLRKIGEQAFFYNSLMTIIIPNGVTFVGTNAFDNTLTTVVIPPSLARYESEISNLRDDYGNLRTREVPTRGFATAFNSGYNITRVTLPANVDERNLAGQLMPYIGSYNTFDEAFTNFWKSQGKKAGTYVKKGPIWTLE